MLKYCLNYHLFEQIYIYLSRNLESGFKQFFVIFNSLPTTLKIKLGILNTPGDIIAQYRLRV